MTSTVDRQTEATGPVRVDLVFEPGARRVRVPHGVTLFDAASWNGIAIDSTCGGTVPARSARSRCSTTARGRRPALDIRAFTPAELRQGWRLACRALALTDNPGGRAAACHQAQGPPRSASAGR